ncbi:putative laminarinase [Panus rudis PR-1116 ss-1]|nr:putative laminarinase [Panus rudis PR-1116 ss-1]
MQTRLLAFLAVLLVPQVFAATYRLSDNHVGSDFLSTFVHENFADPTHGRVTYVDQNTAVSQNLTFAQGNTLILRADSKTKLAPSDPGRKSVRIRSIKTYTTHVAVFDIRHMPQGCGTWPAAWETSVSGWPNLGEVDIVGVNDQSPNAMTLHTSANCNMPASRAQTGTPTGNNCDVNTSGNTGCGVQAPTANSYGPSFNANGGGWYAMERTNNFIKVWFWPRNAGNVPSDVRNGGSNVNTDSWGTPTAFFPNTNCDIGSHFGPNNVIINLTFCGDWAGIPSVFNGAGCPGDCATYVNNNPGAFTNAYWDIAAVRIYT